MSKPVGPYTPIVEAGPWLICSGQIGLADGALVPGGLEPELRQALANMAGLLASKGGLAARCGQDHRVRHRHGRLR